MDSSLNEMLAVHRLIIADHAKCSTVIQDVKLRTCDLTRTDCQWIFNIAVLVSRVHAKTQFHTDIKNIPTRHTTNL